MIPRCTISIAVAACLAAGTAGVADVQAAPITPGVSAPTASVDASGGIAKPTVTVPHTNVNEARQPEINDRAQEIGRDFQSYRDGTNAMLALIATLLALVGLLFPTVIYLTSVLPGNRLIEEARKTLATLDERFAELAAKHQSRLVDQAISRLADESDVARQNAALYLSLNPHFEYTERQLFDICQATRHAASPMRFQLFSLLAGRRSEYVTKLFVDALEGADTLQVLIPIAKQCSMPGSDALRTKMKKWMLSAPEIRRALASSVMQVAMASPSVLRELIDDEAFLSQLGIPERAAALTMLRAVASAHKLADLDQTRLAKSLTGRLSCFVKNDQGFREVHDAADADFLMVFQDGGQPLAFPKSSPEFRAAASAAQQSKGGDGGGGSPTPH